MGIEYYMAWICLIHLTFFAIILFTKNSNRRANRMLGIFMLIFAYMHLTHIFLITKTIPQYHFLNELGFISLFFLGPVYLQYTSYLTGIEIKWKKYLSLHALPFIPPFLFIISFFFKTTEEIKTYYDLASVKEPLDMRIILYIVSAQMGLYMLWSLKLVNRYNLQLTRSNNGSSLSLNWLKWLTIFMLILSFIIAPILIIIIKSDTTALLVYMPAVTLIIYFSLFIKSMNFPSTELEKNAVRLEEWGKFGRDIHDDFGSGLSKISFISNKLKEQLLHDKKSMKQIEKIAQTSQDLVNNMSHIIWTSNSENDTLDSLLIYVREYAVDFLDDFGLQCYINFPETILTTNLLPEQRRNIFLVVKESLNNIIKHSFATHVWIDILIHKNELIIRITDDGKGFAYNSNNCCGNGLKNMQYRMKQIDGKYIIESSIGNGTCTTLSLLLKHNL